MYRTSVDRLQRQMYRVVLITFRYSLVHELAIRFPSYYLPLVCCLQPQYCPAFLTRKESIGEGKMEKSAYWGARGPPPLRVPAPLPLRVFGCITS